MHALYNRGDCCFHLDVACATTHTVSSAVLALEIANEFFIGMKREGKNCMKEANKRTSGRMISRYMNSTWVQGSLEKAAGKLSTKL